MSQHVFRGVYSSSSFTAVALMDVSVHHIRLTRLEYVSVVYSLLCCPNVFRNPLMQGELSISII